MQGPGDHDYEEEPTYPEDWDEARLNEALMLEEGEW